MKLKKILIAILSLTAFFTLVSCDNSGAGDNPPAEITITFNSNGGSTITSQSVPENEKITKPANPTKDGYTFAGWYSDSSLTTVWNFNDPVTKDVTLYAKWEKLLNSYTVTFSGTSMSSVKIEEGKTLSKPTDPSKLNHIFAGWFLDSNFTEKAEFPLKINKDTTLYAQFYSYQDAFKLARNNTIGDNVDGYEYDYTLTASASYAGKALTGTTTGNAKYNKNSSTSLYDVAVSSGILFSDCTKYQIKTGDTLQKLTFDTDNILKKFSSEQVNSDYTFDSSSFAKALFEYSDDQLKSIERTNVANEYKLNTSLGASGIIALIGNNLNNSIVEKVIGALPETDVNTAMYVTFADNTIKNYRYEITITVTQISFNLVYDLTFKNVGTTPVINPSSFDGLYITDTTISTKFNEINSIVNNFINAEKSSYDFELKTGVDYGLTSFEINSKFDGSAMRKIENDTIYFHNDIKINSDYKNSDLYEEAGIDDIHIKKSKLANGDVYNIEKKLLIDSTELIENYTPNDTDSFYLFKILNNITKYSYIQEKTNDDNSIQYTLGLSNDNIYNIMVWLNNELNLDPLNTSNTKVKVLGSFEKTSINITDNALIITIKDNKLVSISFECEGDYITSFENSRDFQVADEATFNIELLLTPTNDSESFEPFETVNDAK